MSQLLENLNKEQLQAVTHNDGPLLIVAGAGTGKTTVITRRIAYLIEQKLALPDEILALTFTEKAAGEMEERVDQLLPLGNYDLWISTFHSFCERLIKQHGLDIGISNDFKILDDIKRWILLFENFDKFKLDYYKPLGSPNKFIDALLDHFNKCKDELITPEEYLAYAENLALQSGAAELLPSK
jgi:DNA helicase-2/ATP-dependent DNA helicase PcrA